MLNFTQHVELLFDVFCYNGTLKIYFINVSMYVCVSLCVYIILGGRQLPTQACVLCRSIQVALALIVLNVEKFNDNQITTTTSQELPF